MLDEHHVLTDTARIEALRQSGLLDTTDEEPFEGITSLARRLLDVPVVLLTLVDAERQFFKSCPGLTEPWRTRRETPLSHSFCQHVVRSGAPLVIEDAREDPLVKDNLAIPDVGVIAYAGVPIVTADGHHLGSLAAIDTVPRPWRDRDVQTLVHLAGFVSKEIDLRIAAHRSEQEAHHALAASEEQVSGILERINDAFVALDTAWRYTYVNQKAGKLFGRDPESLIGKHIWSEFPEGLGQPFHLAYERAMKEQVPITLEEHYEPWGRWFENRIHPSSEGVSIFFTEITDRKLAEQALRESEALLRQLAESLPQAIWLSLASGEILYISSAFEEIWGRSVEEIRHDPSLILADVHPEDREHAGQAFSAITAGEPLGVEYRIVRSDGQVRWLSTRGVPVRGENGTVVRIAGVTEDVTPRKQAEAERERLLAAESEAREQLEEQAADLETALARLREATDTLTASEDRYRRFFEDDLTADYISRVDGTIVMCNQAFVNIFGFRDVEEAMRTDITTLFPDRSARSAMLQNLRQERRLELFEATLQRRDGMEVDIVGNLVGAFDEAGELIEIKGYLFDVTERKALEAQLAQSQKMEMVGRLAGGIAHDFNNMLTAIMGNAQILLDQEHEDTDLRYGLSEISLAAERSAGLTRQLLAFSRKQVLQPKPLDLNRTITGMESMLRRLIGEHIVVKTKLSAAAVDIFVDPSQIEQVILNLVVNARDAMPRGGELTVQTSVTELDRDSAAEYDLEPGPGRYAALSIRDTGHGIDEETREHIFEPFFTTKPVGQGTGLGLSTVYGIVKQSGGAIRLETEVERGTTFMIFLPLHERAAAGTRDAAAPTPPTRGPETILLVEDEPSVRDLIRKVLQRDGYSVVEAASGVQAIRMAEEWQGSIDLVLSDVVMPGMSGQEVVQALRRMLPNVRVLFMSGYAEDAIQQHGALEPDTGFIEKPLTPEALRRKVRETLDGH